MVAVFTDVLKKESTLVWSHYRSFTFNAIQKIKLLTFWLCVREALFVPIVKANTVLYTPCTYSCFYLIVIMCSWLLVSLQAWNVFLQMSNSSLASCSVAVTKLNKQYYTLKVNEPDSVCPRSLDSFYIVTYHTKWVKNSLTCSSSVC